MAAFDRAKLCAEATSAPTSFSRPRMPAIHDSDEAADNITAIPCQRFGSAWQKACRVRSGRLTNRSVTEKTTPDVPSETKPEPGAVAPTPMAEAALSPPPPAIGIRRPSRPQAFATAGERWAETSEP